MRPGLIISALALAAYGCAAYSASHSGASREKALLIQAQGSFAVGGSVVDSLGTFDPIRQGAYTPAPG